MAVSEAARADLYNGLAEVLGADRAEILMSQLPRSEPGDLATKSDLAELREEMREGFREMRAEFDRIDSRFAEVNQRFDRLYLTLVTGLFVVVAAMAGVLFTSL